MKTYQVRIWKLGKNSSGNPRVRWKTGVKSHNRSFANRALADSFRSELVSAARKGEAFDVDSGLPAGMAKSGQGAGETWYEHTVKYVDRKWPELAANSRASMAEALAVVTPVLVRTMRGKPSDAVLRDALYGSAYNLKKRNAELPADQELALTWLRRASAPVAELGEDAELVYAALDALSRKTDGRRAAANTVRRKRAVFYNALGYAVVRKLLTVNPLDQVQWTIPKVEHEVDPRVVASPEQVRQLLSKVRQRNPRLEAFFACMYWGLMRPAEVVDLAENVCRLPDEGWGVMYLEGSRPRSGSAWTDDGKPHERRQLKHRARHAVRDVDIPPELVGILKAHIDKFKVGPGERLFRAKRGGPVHESEYGEVWASARRKALTPSEVSSPLAKRPYDLRHAGVSFLLQCGIDPMEVARRAGHSVDVLLRIYAKVIDGTRERANKRIQEVLEQGNSEDGQEDQANADEGDGRTNTNEEE